MFQLSLGLLLFVISCSFANTRLDDAKAFYKSAQYEAAARLLDSLINFGDAATMEGAIYLRARVYLAREEADSAADICEMMLRKFPNGGFVQYAHYARAEAMFLKGNYHAVKQELEWVKRNAGDTRLVRRADEVLLAYETILQLDLPKESVDKRSSLFPQHYELTEGRIALLIAFPDPEDPAPFSLERGFRYASVYGTSPFQVTIVRVSSSFEAARAARDLMEQDSLLMLLFAGDEGSAMVVTLLSGEFGIPVLKLTSNVRSFTEFSSSLYEFLPSGQTQSRSLGEFATRDLAHPYSLILAPENEEGDVMSRGFSDGVTSSGGTVDALILFPPSATSVRHELSDLFSAEPRVARGQAPPKTILSKKEREQLFGNAGAGEVLSESVQAPPLAPSESFFFSIASENIANFSSQLSIVPSGTTLFGNSSWFDTRALAKQSTVTDGMYIVAPLLPEVSDTSAYVLQYEIATGAPPDPWEVLGIDAAEFVGDRIVPAYSSRSAIKKGLPEDREYRGIGVVTDFRGGRENKFARILQYRDGEMAVVR